jgi:hypothetical protein
MNHGVLMFQQDAFESRLWEMAMSRSQFVAIYTHRSVERSTDGSIRELWHSALVPRSGKSLAWPRCPDLEGNYAEYGRYEPGYDKQFFKMCATCAGWYGHRTVVVPSSACDEGAMDLLDQFDSILDRLDEPLWSSSMFSKFCDRNEQDGRKPKKSPSSLGQIIKPIRLQYG